MFSYAGMLIEDAEKSLRAVRDTEVMPELKKAQWGEGRGGVERIQTLIELRQGSRESDSPFSFLPPGICWGGVQLLR